jgi:PadR family transcriptional regulator AphA
VAGRELNTTSYAVLALLGVRPWTTYELTQQMERSLRWIWPRAASVVYEEPKRLVALGMATSRSAYTGRRRSTMYAITRRGRVALGRWLDLPAGAGPVVEHEALLKVAFADHGTREQLLATLDTMVAGARAQQEALAERAAEYAGGGGPFPDRLPVISLVTRLMLDQTKTVADWAVWARAEVQQWGGVTPAAGARVAAGAFTTAGRGAVRRAG